MQQRACAMGGILGRPVKGPAGGWGLYEVLCAAQVCGSRYAVLRPRTAKLPRPVATPPEPSGHTTKAWLAGHRKY